MTLVTLKIKDNELDKLLAALKQFSSDDLEITIASDEFIAKKVHEDFADYKKNASRNLSSEEFESLIDQQIHKHEG